MAIKGRKPFAFTPNPPARGTTKPTVLAFWRRQLGLRNTVLVGSAVTSPPAKT